MDADSEAGKHFGLPIVGKVIEEAAIYHFGDEAGGGVGKSGDSQADLRRRVAQPRENPRRHG